jgi:DNA-binding LytR/AlgR family response regulator
MMDKKLKCLVVDDEPIGRKIIEDYVRRTPNLVLTASCKDAFEALEILQRQPVDLLFSDIQMPELNGVDLAKSLLNPPAIIFITAHNNFASDSFDLNITDYLLKPVSYERFLKALNKVVLQIDGKQKTASGDTTPDDYIFVKANNKLNKILLSDILYIESVKDYLKIHVSETVLMVYSTMKAIEEKLPVGKFCRIHQSYLVSVEQIKSLMGNVVELTNGASLPVSKSHKADLYKMLNLGE